MILNPMKKHGICEEIFTKPNIGLSLRFLCNLHLIDPFTILSKRLSIDTIPHYWRAESLTSYLGSLKAIRPERANIFFDKVPKFYRLLYGGGGGGHELALFHRNVCKISLLFGTISWL